MPADYRANCQHEYIEGARGLGCRKCPVQYTWLELVRCQQVYGPLWRPPPPIEPERWKYICAAVAAADKARADRLDQERREAAAAEAQRRIEEEPRRIAEEARRIEARRLLEEARQIEKERQRAEERRRRKAERLRLRIQRENRARSTAIERRLDEERKREPREPAQPWVRIRRSLLMRAEQCHQDSLVRLAAGYANRLINETLELRKFSDMEPLTV